MTNFKSSEDLKKFLAPTAIQCPHCGISFIGPDKEYIVHLNMHKTQQEMILTRERAETERLKTIEDAEKKARTEKLSNTLEGLL